VGAGFSGASEALRKAADEAEARLATATQACEYLQARVTELEAQLPDWQPVASVPIGNFTRAAKWLLDLYADEKI